MLFAAFSPDRQMSNSRRLVRLANTTYQWWTKAIRPRIAIPPTVPAAVAHKATILQLSTTATLCSMAFCLSINSLTAFRVGRSSISSGLMVAVVCALLILTAFMQFYAFPGGMCLMQLFIHCQTCFCDTHFPCGQEVERLTRGMLAYALISIDTTGSALGWIMGRVGAVLDVVGIILVDGSLSMRNATPMYCKHVYLVQTDLNRMSTHLSRSLY